MRQTKQRQHVRLTAYAAIIASLYVLFTYISALAGLASGVIQLRLSEALTILPALLTYTEDKVGHKASIIGLTLGCAIANLLTGSAPWDVLFGSLATLLGALGTYALRRHPYLIWIPPVLANVLIVPYILTYVYGAPDSHLFLCFTVGIGEILSAGVLGMALDTLLMGRFFQKETPKETK